MIYSRGNESIACGWMESSETFFWLHPCFCEKRTSLIFKQFFFLKNLSFFSLSLKSFFQASEELKEALAEEERRAQQKRNSPITKFLRKTCFYSRADYSLFCFSPKNLLRIRWVLRWAKGQKFCLKNCQKNIKRQSTWEISNK